MKISVITPSFLGEYKNVASNRFKKFVRAINSFLGQTYDNKELIIVSDGCQKTIELYQKHYDKEKQVRLIQIDKQPLFSGNVRQAGVEKATGDLICYLDSDDMLGKTHLSNLSHTVLGHDWVYFNDFIYLGEHQKPALRNVELKHESIGTSAIAHKKDLNASWEGCNGYGHNWTFIQKLKNISDNFGKIYGCSYMVCHVVGKTDY